MKIVNGDNTPRKKRVPTSARSLESLQLFSSIRMCNYIYTYIEIKVVYNFSLQWLAKKLYFSDGKGQHFVRTIEKESIEHIEQGIKYINIINYHWNMASPVKQSNCFTISRAMSRECDIHFFLLKG